MRMLLSLVRLLVGFQACLLLIVGIVWAVSFWKKVEFYHAYDSSKAWGIGSIGGKVYLCYVPKLQAKPPIYDDGEFTARISKITGIGEYHLCVNWICPKVSGPRFPKPSTTTVWVPDFDRLGITHRTLMVTEWSDTFNSTPTTSIYELQWVLTSTAAGTFLLALLAVEVFIFWRWGRLTWTMAQSARRGFALEPV